MHAYVYVWVYACACACMCECVSAGQPYFSACAANAHAHAEKYGYLYIYLDSNSTRLRARRRHVSACARSACVSVSVSVCKCACMLLCMWVCVCMCVWRRVTTNRHQRAWRGSLTYLAIPLSPTSLSPVFSFWMTFAASKLPTLAFLMVYVWALLPVEEAHRIDCRATRQSPARTVAVFVITMLSQLISIDAFTAGRPPRP